MTLCTDNGSIYNQWKFCCHHNGSHYVQYYDKSTYLLRKMVCTLWNATLKWFPEILQASDEIVHTFIFRTNPWMSPIYLVLSKSYSRISYQQLCVLWVFRHLVTIAYLHWNRQTFILLCIIIVNTYNFSLEKRVHSSVIKFGFQMTQWSTYLLCIGI